MTKHVLTTALLLGALAACQTKPLELPSSTVVDALYNAKNCEEILADRERLERLHEQELQYLPSEGTLRNFRLSIVKIFDADADEPERRRLQRYERIKGQYESAERVAIRRCGYEPPLPPEENSEENSEEDS